MAVSGPIWCQEGLRVAADALVKTAATPDILSIVLFSNDVTVDKDTVYGDLTVIASDGGEIFELTRATWDASTDADPVVSRYNGATGAVWNITGALTIYGWAIVNTTPKVLCAENWGVNTVANGNTVTIQPLDLKFDIV